MKEKHIKSFYQIEFNDGERIIKELTVPIDFNLIVTKRCNANCVHCCANANDEKNNLTLKNLRKIIKIAEKNNIFYFIITGGEPLMYKHFYTLLDLINNKFGIILNSNGTLIDKKVAKKLSKYNIANIHISLDAPNPKIYGLQRGESTKYSDVINGIKNLINNKIDVTTKFIITDINKNNIEKIIKLSISLNVKKLTIAWFKAIGRGKENEDMLELTNSDKIKITKKIYKLKEKYKHKINLSFDDAQCFPFLIKTMKKIKYRKLCGDFFCRIDPQGDLFPCPFLETNIGNIFVEELSSLWKKKGLERLRELSHGKSLKGICKKCSYNDICVGGCRARSLSKYGDLEQKDPFCWIEK